ncbi:MAG: hypothetical protein JXB48_14550 [Candidatus Latescibacteria bacterium]|nr:hypothetical protein [Candidatus Latescibacterota bacterium]
MENEHSFDLNIGIPNGIILTVIGLLVLLTPVFHSMPSSHSMIDIAAGCILMCGGLFSLYLGIKNLRK